MLRVQSIHIKRAVAKHTNRPPKPSSWSDTYQHRLISVNYTTNTKPAEQLKANTNQNKNTAPHKIRSHQQPDNKSQSPIQTKKTDTVTKQQVELVEALVSAGQNIDDVKKRVRRAIIPGTEADIFWNISQPEVRSRVLVCLVSSIQSLSHLVSTLLQRKPAHMSMEEAAQQVAIQVKLVGENFSMDDMLRLFSDISSQVEPRALGILLGMSIPSTLRREYDEIAELIVTLLTGVWKKELNVITNDKSNTFKVYSLQHAAEIATSAISCFESDWVNEEIFESIKQVHIGIGDFVRQQYPQQEFQSEDMIRLMQDLIAFSCTKLQRLGWKNVGFVNGMIQHTSDHFQEEEMTTLVNLLRENLQVEITQKIVNKIKGWFGKEINTGPRMYSAY